MTFYWTEHDPPQTLKCHEGRLERLPTRKPLQLSTVTGSSEGAPRSSEVQDLASLANNACQAAAALACSSPGGERPFFADDDAAVPERRVFDSEFPRKVDGLHLAAEDHSRRRYLELVIATLPLLGGIECLSFLSWCLGKLVRFKGLAA